MNENFDVVIVGSGPVGSAFARTISDDAPGLRVLMVEGGPLITEPAGRHVKTITSTPEREQAQILSQGPARRAHGIGGPTEIVARPGTYLLGPSATQPGEDGMPAAALSSNAGGMGSHWTCACPVPGDGERPTEVPEDEFTHDFHEAWELLSVTQNAFDDSPLSGKVRELLGSAVNPGRSPERQVQPMPLGIRTSDDGSRYWTGPDVILGDLANSSGHPNFELRVNTVAQAIVHSNGKASGVLLKSMVDGEQYEVEARAVVVAGDALRTPQLLFASGIRPPALGKYLNDQPQVVGIVRLADHFISDDARSHPSRAGTVDVLSGVNWIPYDKDTFPYHGQIMQMDASPVPLPEDLETWPGSIVGIGLFAGKDIQEADQLEFDTSTADYQGLPEIKIHYKLSEADHKKIAAMKEEVIRLAGVLGELLTPEPTLLPNGSSLHYQGSVRMGIKDDGTSVCDTHSKVWGTENIYVGGNGVISTPIACNPTATSVALAIRAAHHLVTGLHSSDTALTARI